METRLQEPYWQGLPRAFWYLWLGTLISRLGGFVFTFLAIYLTEQQGFSVEAAGLVVSLYGAGSLCAGPLGGMLADRIGRRATLFGGLFCASVALLHLGFARGFLRIAIGTLLLGCATDVGRPAAQAAVADLVPPEERTRAYGLLYWAINLGFAGAAMLAGLLAHLNFLLLFIGDAVGTFCFGCIVFLRLPETRPVARNREPGVPAAGGTAATLLRLLTPYRDRIFISLVLIHFTVAWVFCQSIVSLPLDMSRHGIPIARFGQLIAINGILIVLLQPLAVRIVTRIARGRVLALGSLLNGCGFGLCAISHSQAFYVLSIVIWTIGEILLAPVIPTLVADLAPRELRGSYQGGFQLCWGAGALLGPAFGGLIMGRLGANALWLLCFVIGVASAWLHLLHARVRRRLLLTLPESAGALSREDGRG